MVLPTVRKYLMLSMNNENYYDTLEEAEEAAEEEARQVDTRVVVAQVLFTAEAITCVKRASP